MVGRARIEVRGAGLPSRRDEVVAGVDRNVRDEHIACAVDQSGPHIVASSIQLPDEPRRGAGGCKGMIPRPRIEVSIVLNEATDADVVGTIDHHACVPPGMRQIDHPEQVAARIQLAHEGVPAAGGRAERLCG